MTSPRVRPAIVAALRRPTGHITGPGVTAELRRVIVSGIVAPGSPVPVDLVAEAFGVSHIPVREALKTLLGEGLIAHNQRSGYHVTQLSADELDEVYVVRGALEAAALDVALRKASTQDYDNARRAHERCKAHLADGDLDGFQKAGREFHEALLQPCYMPRLLHMLEIAWNITEPARLMSGVSADERTRMTDDHAAMLAAYEARDHEELRRISGAHLQMIAGTVRNSATTHPE